MATSDAADPSERATTTLLHVPEDLLLQLAVALGPIDLSSLACAARGLSLLRGPRPWRLFLERTFGDVACAQRMLSVTPFFGLEVADSYRYLFTSLAFGDRPPQTGCPLLAEPDDDGSLPLVELGCGGSLVLRPLTNREQRCPCVAVRTPRLPLRLASLGCRGLRPVS